MPSWGPSLSNNQPGGACPPCSPHWAYWWRISTPPPWGEESRTSRPTLENFRGSPLSLPIRFFSHRKTSQTSTRCRACTAAEDRRSFSCQWGWGTSSWGRWTGQPTRSCDTTTPLSTVKSVKSPSSEIFATKVSAPSLGFLLRKGKYQKHYLSINVKNIWK